MSRKIIHTDKAPAAIGPYSQAVRVGDTVYLSGQIPLDPATGLLVEGDISAQARRAFDNLKAVCEAAGGSLDDVVRESREHRRVDIGKIVQRDVFARHGEERKRTVRARPGN